MKCLIYSRVSTKDQAEAGRSPKDQPKICKRFALENGYKIVGFFEDKGKTGTNMKRPGLQDMLMRCQEDKDIGAVIVQDTDRLARNPNDHLTIKAVLAKAGTKVLSASQPGTNDDSPEGQFTDLIIAAVNALQSQITARKVLKCMKEKFNEGWLPREAYVGYKNVNIGTEEKPKRIIQVDGKKAFLVVKSFEKFATGLFPADKLNETMFKQGLCKKNGNKLSSSEFNRLLKNSFYYGFMRWAGLEKTGRHKPLVSKELFDQCQKVFQDHNRGADRSRKHDFLLRGVITCNLCGHRLTAEHNRAKNVSYYHCASKKHSNKKQNYRAGLLEKRVEVLFRQIELPQNVVGRILEYAKQILNNTHNNVDGEKRQLGARKAQLEEKRNALENKFLEGTVSDETYSRIHPDLEDQIKSLDDEINEIGIDRMVNIKVFEQMLFLTRNVGKAYKQAPPELKKHYLNLFWDKIEVKNCKLIKTVPTQLYAELFPTYNFAQTNTSLSNLKVITTEGWRARRGSNPRHEA